MQSDACGSLLLATHPAGAAVASFADSWRQRRVVSAFSGASHGVWDHLVLPRDVVVSIKFGVRFVGVLVIRALLFGVCIRAPDSWKLSLWIEP